MSLQRAQVRPIENAALFEKVMLKSDLQGLTSIETVQHIKNVCDSLGLNAMTNPIEVIEFQGKRKLYFTKQSTEQLRSLRRVSIEKIETKVHDGGLYTVTAYASLPDGRRDSSTGAISINGLKGEALGNAMMKAETKAKRRVTLSICGLGFMDESEADSIPQSQKISIHDLETGVVFDREGSLQTDLDKIKSSSDINTLQDNFKEASKAWQQRKDMEAIKSIIAIKDERKNQLDVEAFKQELIEDAEVINV
jgi:hypothetical protein